MLLLFVGLFWCFLCCFAVGLFICVCCGLCVFVVVCFYYCCLLLSSLLFCVCFCFVFVFVVVFAFCCFFRSVCCSCLLVKRCLLVAFVLPLCCLCVAFLLPLCCAPLGPGPLCPMLRLAEICALPNSDFAGVNFVLCSCLHLCC